MSAIGSASGSSRLNFTGLGTGLDTNNLVDGLLAPARARIKVLESRQSNVGLQQKTYKALQANLLGLQAQANRLSRSVGGAFDVRSVTSSDETAVKAAGSASAVPGVYSLTVNKLAQNHQIASLGYADVNAVIDTGTLSITVGSGTTTTVTIDQTNNTLQGLAKAINDSGGDVIASLIQDGSATPHRLLLSAKNTGAANAIQVTNSGGATIDLNPATRTIQSAGDAEIVLGSGAGALTLKSANNTVDNVVGGVTLNLLKADSTRTINLTVSNDTGGLPSTINDFVKTFNGVVDFIAERSTYDPQTSQVGVFLSDRSASALQNEITQALNAVVPGLEAAANRLSAIGITFDGKGKLVVDSGKLNNALSSKISGVSLDDVRRIFAFAGQSTNPGVSFVLAGAKTTAPTSPVQVDITTVATQATLVGSSAVAESVAITSGNKSLELSLNGKTATIQLTENTYTATALAQEVRAKINASSEFGGAQVAVSLDGSGKLRITTESFGSTANVEIKGGTALDDLKLTAGQSDVGKDVAGTFTVGGVVESAKGAGQILTGSSGNANTDGLQVRVTLSTPAAGVDAELTLTKGTAARLFQVLDSHLDPVKGRMKNLDDGFQRSIDTLRKSIARENVLMSARNDSLVRRFAGMEALVSRLKSTGDQLTSALAGLAAQR